MNKAPKEVLERGMHIINPKLNPSSLRRIIKSMNDPVERVYWVNETLKKAGCKLFTFRELETMFVRDRRKIKSIIRKLVKKGHLR